MTQFWELWLIRWYRDWKNAEITSIFRWYGSPWCGKVNISQTVVIYLVITRLVLDNIQNTVIDSLQGPIVLSRFGQKSVRTGPPMLPCQMTRMVANFGERSKKTGTWSESTTAYWLRICKMQTPATRNPWQSLAKVISY